MLHMHCIRRSYSHHIATSPKDTAQPAIWTLTLLDVTLYRRVAYTYHDLHPAPDTLR
jgi:hypothetical protein